jgi:hypothetical protein
MGQVNFIPASLISKSYSLQNVRISNWYFHGSTNSRHGSKAIVTRHWGNLTTAITLRAARYTDGQTNTRSRDAKERQVRVSSSIRAHDRGTSSHAGARRRERGEVRIDGRGLTEANEEDGEGLRLSRRRRLRSHPLLCSRRVESEARVEALVRSTGGAQWCAADAEPVTAADSKWGKWRIAEPPSKRVTSSCCRVRSQ